MTMRGGMAETTFWAAVHQVRVNSKAEGKVTGVCHSLTLFWNWWWQLLLSAPCAAKTFRRQQENGPEWMTGFQVKVLMIHLCFVLYLSHNSTKLCNQWRFWSPLTVEDRPPAPNKRLCWSLRSSYSYEFGGQYLQFTLSWTCHLQLHQLNGDQACHCKILGALLMCIEERTEL